MKNFKSIFITGLAISLIAVPTLNLRAQSDNSFFTGLCALGSIGAWIGGCFAFNSYKKSQRISQLKKNNHESFLRAAKEGNLAAVSNALKDSDIVKEIDTPTGNSALCNAVRNEHESVVRSLLAAKASSASIFKWGKKAEAQLLIKSGVSVNASCGSWENPPLVVAADSGNLEVVKLLVGAKADVHRQGCSGSAALYAASAGHDAVLKYLIDDAGVSIESLDNYNRPYIYNWNVFDAVNRYSRNRAIEQERKNKTKQALVSSNTENDKKADQ